MAGADYENRPTTHPGIAGQVTLLMTVHYDSKSLGCRFDSYAVP